MTRRPDEQQPAMPEHDDTQIQKAVEDRLYWDAQINESEVHIRVADGEVALEGTVPSATAQSVAEEHAEALPGVTHVANKLTIWDSQRPTEHSDAELARILRHTVTWETVEGPGGVQVQVNGGVVTLMGEVPTDQARRALVARIQQVTGVLRVVDQLTVTPVIGS